MSCTLELKRQADRGVRCRREWGWGAIAGEADMSVEAGEGHGNAREAERPGEGRGESGEGGSRCLHDEVGGVAEVLNEAYAGSVSPQALVEQVNIPAHGRRWGSGQSRPASKEQRLVGKSDWLMANGEGLLVLILLQMGLPSLIKQRPKEGA